MIKKTTYLLFLVCFLSMNLLSAQEVEWNTWEEATEKSKIEQRKFFVDIYTDFCTWCKKMDDTTFKDPNVIRYLNENFYPVKLNAQQEEDILFDGQTYKFINKGVHSYHELAFQIMNGKMKYPTIAFVDESYEIIQSIPGFRTPFELELFLTYFGEDNHEIKPWHRFKSEQEQVKKNSLIPAREKNSLQIPVGGRGW